MHVHLPKPLHGWREFAGEVGIIVLGVLIALTAEQLVETLHWRSEVADARSALSEDMKQSNYVFAWRVAAHDCIAKRLNRIHELVEQAARHQAPGAVANLFPDIGNALFKNAWETSRAAQVLAHFDRESLGLYGAYYLQLNNIDEFMLHEVDDLAVLRVLEGDPNRLGATDIAGLRVAVKRASFENDIIADIAQKELETSRLLGVGAPPPDRPRLATVCRSL